MNIAKWVGLLLAVSTVLWAVWPSDGMEACQRVASFDTCHVAIHR